MLLKNTIHALFLYQKDKRKRRGGSTESLDEKKWRLIREDNDAGEGPSLAMNDGKGRKVFHVIVISYTSQPSLKFAFSSRTSHLALVFVSIVLSRTIFFSSSFVHLPTNTCFFPVLTGQFICYLKILQKMIQSVQIQLYSAGTLRIFSRIYQLLTNCLDTDISLF